MIYVKLLGLMLSAFNPTGMVTLINFASMSRRKLFAGICWMSLPQSTLENKCHNDVFELHVLARESTSSSAKFVLHVR
jgi:hypothetical protein